MNSVKGAYKLENLATTFTTIWGLMPKLICINLTLDTTMIRPLKSPMYNINLATSCLEHFLESDIAKIVRIRGHRWGRPAYLLVIGSGVNMWRPILLQTEVVLCGLVVDGILEVHRVHGARAASVYDIDDLLCFEIIKY